MLTSLAYFIVALALASSILVAAIPLAPLTIEPYPTRRAVQENTNRDVLEDIHFESPLPTPTSEGDPPNTPIYTLLFTYTLSHQVLNGPLRRGDQQSLASYNEEGTVYQQVLRACDIDTLIRELRKGKRKTLSGKLGASD
jgi:hypothetical protein